MSTWSTPFQDDSSDAGELTGHDYPANGLLQNRSNVSPSISSFTECSSPRVSLDEMGVDHPSTTSATASPIECPGSQRSSDELMENRLHTSLVVEQLTERSSSRPSSDEPLADLTSASSGTAAPTGRPNAQDSSIDLASNVPCAETAILTRTESPNAQQPSSQTGTNVPFMGTFSIPDSEVRDKMQRLSQDLESAVRQLFLSSGIEIGHPAEFEPTLVLELEKLYESALGTKDWRSRAVELQMHGIPRAFDLLIALVGAAVHRWVLDHVHPWRGPALEYLGSQLHRRHVDRVVAQHTGMEVNTLFRLAAISELQDPAYDSAEVRPEARRLAGDLKLFLAQHLRRLFRNQPEALLHALGEQWSTALTDLFAGALHLVARLKLASEEYVFSWPSEKASFLGQSMQSKYSGWEHTAFKEVVIALWPGVAVSDGKVGIQVVSRAYVIAT
ncbi:hypothetical protein KC330_g9066 [Hortaea werneckii]|nr:hypothetical protein KC330_g9066 [Hortaea werneckii]